MAHQPLEQFHAFQALWNRARRDVVLSDNSEFTFKRLEHEANKLSFSSASYAAAMARISSLRKDLDGVRNWAATIWQYDRFSIEDLLSTTNAAASVGLIDEALQFIDAVDDLVQITTESSEALTKTIGGALAFETAIGWKNQLETRGEKVGDTLREICEAAFFVQNDIGIGFDEFREYYKAHMSILVESFSGDPKAQHFLFFKVGRPIDYENDIIIFSFPTCTTEEKASKINDMFDEINSGLEEKYPLLAPRSFFSVDCLSSEEIAEGLEK